MGLLSPNDVLEESWLLLFTTGLLGLRVFGPRRLRWISYAYAVLLTASYYALFFLTRVSIRRHYDSLKVMIYYFEDQELQGYFNLVIVPAIIYSGIFKSFENFGAHKRLVEIDRLLLYLNNPIDHEIQMRKEVVNLLINVLIAVVINLFTYFSLVTEGSGYIFNVSRFLNSVPIILEVITLCEYDIFVEKIRVRFGQINRVIRDLMGSGKISVILVQSTEINNALKLRLARRVHLQLHDAASAINAAYGLRLFLIFFATLISVINCFRKALNLLENDFQVLDLSIYLIWTSFHIGKYFHLASSCRTATAEAKRPAEFFYETSSAHGSAGLNEEAEALSRQIINRQLQFNVFTVFSIDFPKGLTIFIAVLTYFLLLA